MRNAHKRNKVFFTIKTILPLLFLTVALVFGVLNIQTIRLWFAGASGEEANIFIDTQAILGPMPRPWRNLAQGGEDHNWNMKPIVPKIAALHPEYIRIDHLYDFFDIVSRENGQLQFNWSKIDVLVTDILATGAKPFFSLSYTPAALNDGNIIEPPSNYGEYQLVIQRTVEHFSKELAIEHVIYEVWNEPDLFGGWKVYGNKNYLSLYAAAARGAQAAALRGALPFKIGGPATTALYKNWVDSLLTFATEQGLRLDFISWHRYDRELSVYEKDFANVSEWIGAFPQYAELELYITEWGHDPKNDVGYDGMYAAAHTAAGALAMTGKIQRMFVFEVQDGKDPAGQMFWGRWGLLAHQDAGNKEKSRYYALKFIDQIADQRLQIQGTGSWVKGIAAKNGNTVEVILTNFDPLSRHTETVPLTFTNLENQNFIYKQTSLDNISRSEEIATTEAELRVNVPMTANSILKITLTPQIAQ